MDGGGVMPNYAAIADEINADPLARGYAAMSDQEVADSMNAVDRVRTLERLDQASVYNNIDVGEYTGLSNANKTEVWNIVQVGGAEGLWVRPGDTARTRLIAIFGGGSATITALGALLDQPISRAEEIGLGEVNPPVVNISSFF